MKRLALLGASGHGKVVADAAELSGWEQIEFYDDKWPERDKNGHWPVVGNSQHLIDGFSDYDAVLVSIGNCKIRLKKHRQLASVGAVFATIIHPSATISRYAVVGAGTVVMAGAILNAYVETGAACIINTGATVDHDCRLSEAVHMAPGTHLSGNVVVGSCGWIGVGACVKQGVRIGDGSLVGAGAVVVHSVPDYQVVVGNPARVIKTEEHQGD